MLVKHKIIIFVKNNMKKIIYIFLFFYIIFCSSLQAFTPTVVGKWFGQLYGGPMEIEFREDQTVTIQTDSFSSLSFNCRYKINLNVNFVTIDLIDIPGGIIFEGIIKFSSDNEMELFGFFGSPGNIKRPNYIDSNSKRLDALYVKLSEESKLVQSKKIESPPKLSKLAFDRNKRLGHGINLNGLLDNNSGQYHLYPTPDQPIKEEYIKMIAEAGFNSVRIPITWSAHASKKFPYTIEPDFFKKVDKIVDLCLKNNLAVSIDIHYYPYINMSESDDNINFEDNITRFYSFWGQISEHYKNYPPELYFDILNEPSVEMGEKLWNKLIVNSLKIIRRTNPNRTVIIGTPNLGQSWTIGLLDLPKDDWNLIVQIHYYLPQFFTHQGLSYAQSETSEGTKWLGTPEEKKPIIDDFNYCVKWGKEHHRPINLGEFGVIDKADMESRVRYLSFIRELTDQNNISFHIWGFREIFRIFDEKEGKWQEPIINAINPTNNYIIKK